MKVSKPLQILCLLLISLYLHFVGRVYDQLSHICTLVPTQTTVSGMHGLVDRRATFEEEQRFPRNVLKELSMGCTTKGIGNKHRRAGRL